MTRPLAALLPGVLKPLLRPLYSAYCRWTHAPGHREELHNYWRHPPDVGNQPAAYRTVSDGRSELLVDLFRRHVSPESTVLEIGCNAGRNLDYLDRTAGYHRLTAIEISEDAVRVLRASYPNLAGVPIHVAPVEDCIRGFPDRAFDAVFTMAVLVHLHEESAWVFGEIARVTGRTLVTIEDEHHWSWRHFARKYHRIFTPLGFRQVEARRCTAIVGLDWMYVARVFQRG